MSHLRRPRRRRFGADRSGRAARDAAGPDPPSAWCTCPAGRAPPRRDSLSRCKSQQARSSLWSRAGANSDWRASGRNAQPAPGLPQTPTTPSSAGRQPKRCGLGSATRRPGMAKTPPRSRLRPYWYAAPWCNSAGRLQPRRRSSLPVLPSTTCQVPPSSPACLPPRSCHRTARLHSGRSATATGLFAAAVASESRKQSQP